MVKFHISIALIISLISAQTITATPDDGDIDLDRFETPGEILENIEKEEGDSIEKSWSSDDCEVSIYRDEHGNSKISWKKGDDEVVLVQYEDKTSYQAWDFGPSVRIVLLVNKVTKTIHEEWNMEDVTMLFHKNKDTKIFEWESNKKNVKTMKKYRNFMHQWCGENQAWINMPCIIYNKAEVRL